MANSSFVWERVCPIKQAHRTGEICDARWLVGVISLIVHWNCDGHRSRDKPRNNQLFASWRPPDDQLHGDNDLDCSTREGVRNLARSMALPRHKSCDQTLFGVGSSSASSRELPDSFSLAVSQCPLAVRTSTCNIRYYMAKGRFCNFVIRKEAQSVGWAESWLSRSPEGRGFVSHSTITFGPTKGAARNAPD